MKFKKLLRPVHLTAVIFFIVSGGPYGLEPLLHNVGAAAAIALVLLIPIVWSLPVILMVLELNGMMPKEGGYYQWVKTGLGLEWGFYEGWWTWLYALTDLAIYPVLFVLYLSFFLPAAAAFKLPICLAVIWICALVNILGIIPVGRSAVALGFIVLAPFLALFGTAITGGPQPASSNSVPLVPTSLAALCMGLFNVMWNYLGWDGASTIAEEVYTPVRSFVISTGCALILIVVCYFFSLLTGMRSGIDPRVLEENGFPALGLRLGGWWLGALLSGSGLASALGLFLASILAVSRLPRVMADDRLLPQILGRLNSVSQVPDISILACAAVVSFMVLWNFGELLIIDVTLYSAALIPEFIALIALRRRDGGAQRPFRIPLGVPGLVVMTALPVACIALALGGLIASGTIHAGATWFAIGTILTGPVVWWAIRRRLS